MSDLTPAQIALLIEFGEAEAFVNSYLCAPAEFVKKFRVEAKRIGSIWVVMIPELDSTFFNRIMCLGIRDAATESMLDDAIGIF